MVALTEAAGLTAEKKESLQHHVHAHLDVFVDGKRVVVPAAIGIKTNIVSQEFATFLDTIETPHAAPMGWVGWFQDYPDPSDFIDPILSCASAVKGGANAALYCNKDVDAEAAAAKGEQDPAKRTAAYQKIQTKIMADAPWAPFRHQDWYTLIGKNVGGFAIHPVWQYDVRNLWKTPG